MSSRKPNNEGLGAGASDFGSSNAHGYYVM